MFSYLTFFITAIADLEDSEETKSTLVNTQLIPKSSEVGLTFLLNLSYPRPSMIRNCYNLLIYLELFLRIIFV